MSYNKVILMGNLTRDPELRYTQNNMAVCKVGMALNRKAKDSTGNWTEAVTFVDVTIFDKRGEAFSKFHRKGSQALVEGELRLDQWQDKATGQNRSKLYVVANNWEFVGSKESATDQQGGDRGSRFVEAAPAWGQTDDSPF